MYLGLFLILLGATFTIFFNSVKTSNSDILTCKWNGQSFKADDEFYFSSLSHKIENWTMEDKMNVASKCFSLESKLSTQKDALLNVTSGLSDIDVIKIGGKPVNSDQYAPWVKKYTGIDVSDNNNYRQESKIYATIFSFAEGLLVALLVEIGFFELVRRIFYYVILGNLRPKK